MKFDYLQPAQDAVIEGFENDERIYALEQAEYKPIRTLLAEKGDSAIYRCQLTSEQRQMVADGADVLIEILHFGGPLAPSRVMLLDQRGAAELVGEERDRWREWLIAQLNLVELHKFRDVPAAE